MKPYFLEIYLLLINIAAFLLISAECLRYRKRQRMLPLLLFILLVSAGGSLGTFLAYCIFGQHPQGHDNTNVRDDFLNRKIPSLLFMIIDFIIYLFYIKGFSIFAYLPVGIQNSASVSKTAWILLIAYIAAMNILSFSLFGIDKRKAAKNRSRISIRTLFIVSAIGGTIGALLGMKVFHHKTQKLYFRLGIPLIMVIHILLIMKICLAVY